MVSQAVEGGVNMIQFRDTDMHGTERLHAAVKLREITESKALFIVNGDIDLAKKARLMVSIFLKNMFLTPILKN